MNPATLDGVRFVARTARRRKTRPVPRRVRFDHVLTTCEMSLREAWLYERMPNVLTLVGETDGTLTTLTVPKRVALSRLRPAQDLPALYQTRRHISLERFVASTNDPSDFGSFVHLVPATATNVQFGYADTKE